MSREPLLLVEPAGAGQYVWVVFVPSLLRLVAWLSGISRRLIFFIIEEHFLKLQAFRHLTSLLETKNAIPQAESWIFLICDVANDSGQKVSEVPFSNLPFLEIERIHSHQLLQTERYYVLLKFSPLKPGFISFLCYKPSKTQHAFMRDNYSCKKIA